MHHLRTPKPHPAFPTEARRPQTLSTVNDFIEASFRGRGRVVGAATSQRSLCAHDALISFHCCVSSTPTSAHEFQKLSNGDKNGIGAIYC